MTKRRIAKRVPEELRDKVLAKIQGACKICPDCEEMWNWTGNNQSNMERAVVEIDATRYNVRRSAYQIIRNHTFKDGLCLVSQCDCPTCINPNKMQIITRKEMLRRKIDGGLMFTAGHVAALRIARRKRSDLKLDMDKAHEIRSSNESATALAKKFGVSREAVCMVRRGETWRTTVGNVFAGLMR